MLALTRVAVLMYSCQLRATMAAAPLHFRQYFPYCFHNTVNIKHFEGLKKLLLEINARCFKDLG